MIVRPMMTSLFMLPNYTDYSWTLRIVSLSLQ